jgi:hypothetical protein
LGIYRKHFAQLGTQLGFCGIDLGGVLGHGIK